MVAQDPTKKADAPYLERVRMPVVRLGEEVYHVAPSGADPEQVEDTIRHAANAWPALMAVVTQGPTFPEELPGGDIPRSLTVSGLAY